MSARRSLFAGVWPFYLVNALGSCVACLLQTGIFFYTVRRLGWTFEQNLLLSTAQALFYVGGAMSAGRISAKLGRGRAVAALSLSISLAATATMLIGRPWALVGFALLFTLCSSACWPALESLICSNADGRLLSGRIGVYNLVWSGINTLMLSASGMLVEHWPGGILWVPIVGPILSVFILTLFGRASEQTSPPRLGVEPEPELLRLRTAALWLSRIMLPATYVVVFALAAMLPSLPVLQPLTMSARTAIGSAWFAGRWITFLILGKTRFWHTRPWLMLAAGALMLVSFVGTVVPPSAVAHSGGPYLLDVLSTLFWQMLLGAALGIIYSASLYFGMVLSDGSTEHGGYHEALIGLGWMLGTGCAALAQHLHPGSIAPAVIAVCGVIGLCLAGALVAAVVSARRRPVESLQIGGGIS